MEDLLTGVAMHLADNDVLAWRVDGSAYFPTEVALFVGVAMPDQPDQAVVMQLYDTAEEIARDDDGADAVMYVQFRFRGPARTTQVYPPADTTAEAVYKAFGLPNVDTIVLDTGVVVLMFDRTSVGQLGQDAKGRPERTDNYAIHVTRPS